MDWIRMWMKTGFLFFVCCLMGLSGHLATTAQAAEGAKAVCEAYPDLTSGLLSFARLEHLSSQVLLRSEALEITAQELEAEVQEASPNLREQLRKNGVFLLEQMAMPRLLIEEALQASKAERKNLSPGKEMDLVQRYLQSLAESVSVTEEEVRDFYEKNRDLFGGASFTEVQSSLKAYLLEDKKQLMLKEHLRTLGQRRPVSVNAQWFQKQYELSRDNPVDKARTSGLPTLVDFGSTGCRPCDMMTPILELLRKKYEGRLNVLFVHVGKEQILATRYGIQGIPLQIFFDKSGKEVSRHTGFFAQAEIEKKLTEIGVQ